MDLTVAQESREAFNLELTFPGPVVSARIGHFVYLDEPERFAREVVEFVSGG